MRRLRGASKAPVAVAGILAVPLFFVGLMAFSLKVDKPSHHLTKKGTVGARRSRRRAPWGRSICSRSRSRWPSSSWACLPCCSGRASPSIVPAVAAIVASVLLVLPLATWAAGTHEALPARDRQHPALSPGGPVPARGVGAEREDDRPTDRCVVIAIGLAAIIITVALDVRRRSGRGAYVPPPPPAIAGEPAISSGLELEGADWDLARGDRPGRWRN